MRAASGCVGPDVPGHAAFELTVGTLSSPGPYYDGDPEDAL